MPNSKESSWKKYITMIRDIVFVVLFLVSVRGWIRSETKADTRLEVQVEVLNTKVTEILKQLEKQNNILSEQQMLNGKIIQYMEMR